MRFSAILGACLLVVSGSVLSASSDAIQLDVTKPDFGAQQNVILKAINTDVAYGEISSQDRILVTKSLTDIADMLKQHITFASVPADMQQQILSIQKSVNEALVQAKKDSRLVCKKEPVLGSNFDRKVCRTAAQLKRENDKVRDESATGRPKI